MFAILVLCVIIAFLCKWIIQDFAERSHFLIALDIICLFVAFATLFREMHN